MTFKQWFFLTVVAGSAGGFGWYLGTHHTHPPASSTPSSASGTRKILYYQSGMHPWIKSDRPGNCTICGMPLTPVYEGDPGLASVPGMVALSDSIATTARVQTSTATRRPLVKTLRVSGTIDDNDAEHRRLSAYIEGRIETLYIRHTGAEVVQGQPLASFHSPMLLSLQREYVTLVKQLETAPPALKSELQQLKRSAAHRLTLMGISQAQIDALPSQPEDEHLVQILAPMSGTVVSREVYAGQYVKEGDRLFEIADFSTMWFKFDAYERDLAWLRTGQYVDVTTASVPGKIFKGSIRFIDPNLVESTRSAKVRVELPNPIVGENENQHRELFHRVFAEGSVILTTPEVLTIPRSAVLNPDGSPRVYLDLGEGHYRQKEIRLGKIGDTDCEVLEGLNDRDKVVTQGNLLIDSQAQINADTHSDAPASSTVGDPTLGPIRAEALKAAQPFFSWAGELSHALSQDDLAGYHRTLAQGSAPLQTLVQTFSNAPAWSLLVSNLTVALPKPDAQDLASARKQFAPWSDALVALTSKVRKLPGSPGLKVYECPMAKKSFPGAPNKAVWIQTEGPLRNPYFGAEMIDCGQEIP